MPTQCSVFECFQKQSKQSSVRFFRFPQDIELKRQWIAKCRRSDNINTDNARVCSLHFESVNFKRNLKYELLNIPVPNNQKVLEEDAVPTMLLPSASLHSSRSSVSQSQNASSPKWSCYIIINESLRCI